MHKEASPPKLLNGGLIFVKLVCCHEQNEMLESGKWMKKKALIVILRLSGLLLITAFIAAFLPYETMAWIHEQIGMGHFPKLPILDYLARSVSLFYGIHGVIVLYISFDMMRYLKFLKLLCYLGSFLGSFFFGST